MSNARAGKGRHDHPLLLHDKKAVNGIAKVKSVGNLTWAGGTDGGSKTDGWKKGTESTYALIRLIPKERKKGERESGENPVRSQETLPEDEGLTCFPCLK